MKAEIKNILSKVYCITTDEKLLIESYIHKLLDDAAYLQSQLKEEREKAFRAGYDACSEYHSPIWSVETRVNKYTRSASLKLYLTQTRQDERRDLQQE